MLLYYEKIRGKPLKMQRLVHREHKLNEPKRRLQFLWIYLLKNTIRISFNEIFVYIARFVIVQTRIWAQFTSRIQDSGFTGVTEPRFSRSWTDGAGFARDVGHAVAAFVHGDSAAVAFDYFVCIVAARTQASGTYAHVGQTGDHILE